MIGDDTDSPNVAAINKLNFPWCDGSESAPAFDVRSVFGVEHMFNMPIFDDIAITSTSQLIVVGEYNEPVTLTDTGDFLIDMTAGFASEYFE